MSGGTAPLPAQRTPGRLELTRSEVHSARNILYAVRVATYSLAELGDRLPRDDRRQLRESIDSEIERLRKLLDL